MSLESLSPEILLGAIGGALKEPEAFRPRRGGAPVRNSIALALNDDHRATAGESPPVIEPVGKWLVAQDDAVFGVFVAVFELGVPEDQEDGAAAQEESMGAVVDVLSAKVPPVDLEGLLLATCPNS